MVGPVTAPSNFRFCKHTCGAGIYNIPGNAKHTTGHADAVGFDSRPNPGVFLHLYLPYSTVTVAVAVLALAAGGTPLLPFAFNFNTDSRLPGRGHCVPPSTYYRHIARGIALSSLHLRRPPHSRFSLGPCLAGQSAKPEVPSAMWLVLRSRAPSARQGG